MTTDFSYGDKDLLEQIADGDAGAFRIFFIRYSPVIENWVRQFVKNGSETDEVLQDIFIQIWIYRDRLTVVENLMPWLKTVTSHQCFKYLQREKARINKLATYQQSIANDPQFSTVGQQIEYKDITAIVQSVLTQLSPQQLHIYQLSRIEGLNSTQIAGKLKLSRGHVRNTIGIVLQKIREGLRERGQLYLLAGIFYFS